MLRLEDQHGAAFRYLLVYPSDPRAPALTNPHVLPPGTGAANAMADARLGHDRALKLNSGDFRVAVEGGGKVLYVNMPVAGPCTYNTPGSRPAAVTEARMPWVGYERISGGAYDGWLRYTASDGQQATLDPALMGNCPQACPYPDPAPAAAGRQHTYAWGTAMRGWFTKQTVVGLYRECLYEPAIGAMRCGYIDDRNRDGIEGHFADLPFPYCPSPVVSSTVDLTQCNTRVRTDGSIRTMEDYVLPPWKAPSGRTVDLWADDRPCVTGTAPSFGTQSVASLTWIVGREIPVLVLPEATGGEGPLTYHLAPNLPPGVTRNGFVISGTPTRVFNGGGYVWLAKDKDGDSAAISFRLAVR